MTRLRNIESGGGGTGGVSPWRFRCAVQAVGAPGGAGMPRHYRHHATSCDFNPAGQEIRDCTNRGGTRLGLAEVPVGYTAGYNFTCIVRTLGSMAITCGGYSGVIFWFLLLV